MRTKTYFASSVPAALETARRELGDNALLVSSKPAPPHARQYGRLEVTFAWDAEEAAIRKLEQKSMERKPIERKPLEWQANDAGGIKREPVPAQRAASSTAPSSEIDEIRRQLSALRVAVGQTGHLPDAAASSPPGSAVSGAAPSPGTPAPSFDDTLMVERLVEAGFSRFTAVEIAADAARRPGNPETAVIQELTGRIPVAPFVEMQPGENRTLAFVGPAGRGKTVSLVKIAITFGLARRIPVRIYSAGSHGVGDQEQMARFAAILGVPYQCCESLASLNLALSGEAWKGLLLIDTPGLALADRTELSEFATFFEGRPEIEKHLVLRADASFADSLHMLSRFSALKPSRLLFTGLDEAAATGSAVETLIRTGIPATFGGTGQQIPEDLEELTAERLARAIWTGANAPSGVTRSRVRQAAA